MKELRPHRAWISLFALAVVIGAGSPHLLHVLKQKTEDNLATTQSERTVVEQSLKQLEDDIGTAQKLNGQISAEEEAHMLAPVDRLAVASLLEREASELRLGHFTYTLSPEEKYLGDNVGAGSENLSVSAITLSADVPLDTTAYKFIDSITQNLPGRLRLQQLSLERTNKNGETLSAYNIRLSATFEWISNGAAPEWAGRI